MTTISPFDLPKIEKKVREKVGGRGDGTLLFDKRASGSIEAYYLYLFKGKEFKIKIGPYKATRATHGYTLAECREKAQELSRLRRECGGDLKGHIEAQEKLKEQEQLEEQQRQEAEALKGSFIDLIQAYVDDQEQQGKDSAHQTRQGLERNVIKAYPAIAIKKARDVTPDDIVTILAAIHNRGSEGESVRVRSLLHACFNFGMKGDYDPTRVGEKRFYIQHNPVSATKKNTKAVNVGERVLSHDELRQLWFGVGNVHRVGFVMACFIRFMLATGGQRPKQLLQARWNDYDFTRNCVTLIDRKGRQGTKKIHVVPLSARALSILNEVREFSGSYPWPFCSGAPSRKTETKGQLVPITLESLKNGFIRYNKCILDQAEREGRQPPAPFTARDIRRTVKNILIDAGVNREQRNLLQSHAQTGVDVKHYDRHEHLPEKRESMRMYDAFLERILNGVDTKLVDLDEYRQTAGKK
ncbi:site-specific integrase [Salinisphaera sp. G21_0]|uniref:tyrosine-type recombinase/integrase n=1 Tax=Salinisphaera sp. G21_0 TaxID=2821094 RepID=UPI001ADA9909|nr:site-specific integrase [Salinisphaera sp. G21_0]MBO9482278.1 site-specific integrase [Salinisphaera sp. G21_0]